MNITLDYINNNPHRVLRYGEVNLNCPICNDEKMHLYVNTLKRVYICHRCGAKGKMSDEVKVTAEEFNNMIDSIQRKLYLDKQGNPPFAKDSNEVWVGPSKTIKTLPNSKPCIQVPDHPGTQYLLNRGVKLAEMSRYEIRVSLEKEGRYKNTVIFPIYYKTPGGNNIVEAEGYKLKYFVCRKYTSEQPKYINAPWNKGDTVFDCHSPLYDGIVVVEGILDALAVSRAGYRAIALLGKTATSGQLDILQKVQQNLAVKNRPISIYLDEDAFTQAIQLKMQLMALDYKANIIRTPKDPASICVFSDGHHSPDILRKIINESIAYHTSNQKT